MTVMGIVFAKDRECFPIANGLSVQGRASGAPRPFFPATWKFGLPRNGPRSGGPFSQQLPGLLHAGPRVDRAGRWRRTMTATMSPSRVMEACSPSWKRPRSPRSFFARKAPSARGSRRGTAHSMDGRAQGHHVPSTYVEKVPTPQVRGTATSCAEAAQARGHT